MMTFKIKTRSENLFRSLLVAAFIIFVLTVLISSVIFVPKGGLDTIGFGFFGYAQSLAETSQYKSCTPDYCDFATRMPFLPSVIALLSSFSHNHFWAASYKNIIMGIISYLLMLKLYQIYSSYFKNVVYYWFLLLVPMVLLGVVAKHAAEIQYEEGVIIWFIMPFTLSLFLLSAHQLPNQNDFITLVAISCSIAVVFYLTKSSLIFIFLLLLLVVLSQCLRKKSFIALSILAVVTIVPFAWGTFVMEHTKRFSLMSSWDGENLYRGWNAETARLFPQVSLDREFDSKTVIKPDGEVVDIAPQKLRKDFASEWEWNDYYKEQALKNIMSDDRLFYRLALVKLQNFFMSITKTPLQYSDRPVEANFLGKISDVVTEIWLIYGRIMQAGLVVLCLVLIIRSDSLRFGALLMLCLNALYALPYIIGFSYERHITAGLVFVISSLMALLPAIEQEHGYFLASYPGVA